MYIHPFRLFHVIFLLLVAMNSPVFAASEEACGSLFEDTSWPVDPANRTLVENGTRVTVHVTCSVVLYPGATLDISPNTDVRFDAGTNLEVRGALRSIGTVDAGIVFEAVDPSAGWSGIQVQNNQGGSAEFDYATISDASSAVSVQCCWSGGPVTINKSILKNNNIGSAGYAGWRVEINHTEFRDNGTAVSGADKEIRNSNFIGNDIGVNAERTSVYDSHFESNRVAIRGRVSPILGNIIVNNEIGLEGQVGGIVGNTISGNDKGIVLPGNSGGSTIQHNNIFENLTYNVENQSAYDTNIANNYFGSTDGCIIEDKIFDLINDNSKGLVTYSPVLSSEYTGEPAPASVIVDRCPTNTSFYDVFSDTTWYAQDGPFLIEEPVTVYSGATLIIEPGTEVVFKTGTDLEVRGHLTAEGLESNPISMRSESGLRGGWSGIRISNNLGGSGRLANVNIEDASTAVSVQCCHNGGPLDIVDSTIQNSHTALGGYAGWRINVDNVLFENNGTAVSSADKSIANSTFRGNEYAIHNVERTSVDTSVFEGNDVAVTGRPVITNSRLENNRVAVLANSSGLVLTGNVIRYNEEGVNLPNAATVTGNDIFGNTSFNIKNQGSANKVLPGNWLGSIDPCTIEETIIDGLDDGFTGLVYYSPALDGPISTQPAEIDLDKCLTAGIPGLIFGDVTWALQDSPVVLDNNVVVYPGASLTIEPGVEVVASMGVRISIRGELTAIGQPEQKIVFRGSQADMGFWSGIGVENNQGGRALFEHVHIRDTATAVSVQCCWEGGPVTLTDATIENSFTGLGGYAGWKVVAERTTFVGNHTAVSSADKEIIDSIFIDNQIGMTGERMSVLGSLFEGNDLAFRADGSARYNEFTGNDVAVDIYRSGLSFTENEVHGNRIGFLLFSGNGTALIQNNNIYDNTEWQMKVRGIYNKSVPYNWWGTTDTMAIDAGIYDGYDEPHLGLVEYQPILTEPAFTSVDNEPPVLSVVGTFFEATSLAGAVVTYDLLVTDDMDPNPSFNCNPVSGDILPLGETTVTCTASDVSGNSAQKTFVVTVADTTPPALTTSVDLTIETQSDSGAQVTYAAATASDLVDPAPVVNCSPASGSLFPSGTTVVICTATDIVGNTSTESFLIRVLGNLADGVTIGEGTDIGQDVSITQGVSIGDNSVIGDGVEIKNSTEVGDNVEIGADVVLEKDISVGDGSTIGSETTVSKDTAIGSNVEIGDSVDIRKDVTIGDRTMIGDGSVIEKSVTIGQDVNIGENVTVKNGAVIADGTIIEDGATCSGNPAVCE